jgi:two-component system, NtrC family, response regulator HydG
MVIGRNNAVTPADFPFQSAAPPPGLALNGGRRLEDVERAYVEQVLREVGGNLSQAARVLDIDRGTLYHKLRRYGIR